MKIRSHHKVGRESIYCDKEADAPWPAKAYFMRLGLFAVELISLASWCMIIPLIEARYVSGWGNLWARTQPLAAFIGIGFVSAALILSINPLAVPLSSFKNLLAWTSPPGFVWKLLRALARPFKPTAPCFFIRLLFLLMIASSVISWNFVLYLIRPWIGLSRDQLDRLVVYETLAAIPVAYLANRWLDRLKQTKRNPYSVKEIIHSLFCFTSPAVWFYHLVFRQIVLLVCRLRYGRFHEPLWL
jgi:hypothetical protein